MLKVVLVVLLTLFCFASGETDKDNLLHASSTSLKVDASNKNYKKNIPKINLTEKEKDFINSHDIECVTTDTWEPFNGEVDGEVDGIAIDYWNIIKTRLNLKSHCNVVENWSTVLKMIKDKKADLTISTDIAFHRKKFAVFSKPYVSFPIVIATRSNIGFIQDMDILKGKKVAVGKDYTAYEYLKANFPDIDIVETKNTNEALELLKKGDVFAAVDVLPVLSYKIGKYGFSTLKISGKTPWTFDFRIMVRDDYKDLITAINKAIDSITPQERMDINNRWAKNLYRTGYSSDTVLALSCGFSLLVIMTLVWVFYLKKEIGKRVKLEVELEKLATTDRLTNIFNRYKMDITLEQEVELSKRYKRPFSMIYLDIDHFKMVNDTYGHKIGDMILVELSKLIQKSIRKSDVFGRWGGEEFLIILPETHKEEALELAKKLRKIVENHNFLKVKKLTCSFGVAEFKEGDDAQSIIMRIDKRLYVAKKSGRNRVESI